jgi:hypothetical protein
MRYRLALNGVRFARLVCADGHQDLPSESHEVAAMAIAEADVIRWSLRREICSDRCRLFVAVGDLGSVRCRAPISQFWFLRKRD